MNSERLARIARALANPTRVRILRLLSAQSDCVGGDIFSELPLAQSTVSEHLRILREAGLVQATPAGTSTVYCIDTGPLDELALALADIAASTPACIAKES
jgi:ArsR family transcriptional regulator